jgi:hypothetical protein
MSDDKKPQADSDTILLTLDQIGQTIDIMTSVVGRLRGYITEQMDETPQQQTETPTTHSYNSHTIH